MMRSLYSGVSGLKGHQTKMDVVGNNIANVNTTGFKSSRVTFADTLSQTQTDAVAPGNNVGGINPKQIGLGTGVASVDLLFTDASVQATGKNTDVALSGNGLFVVKGGSETYYTRDGAFEFDADGNYVLPGSGHYVQGWLAKDGVLNTNSSTENIVVKSGKVMDAKSTGKIAYEHNLDAASLSVVAISGGNPSKIGTKTYTSATEGTLTGTAAYPLTLALADGTTATTPSGSYKVGDSYSQNITSGSATASSVLDVKLNLADGSTVNGTSGVTYTIGNDYSYTTTSSGDTITANPNRRVLVSTSDGYVTGELTSGTYTVGDSYTYSGDSIMANYYNTVTATLANGETITGSSGTTYTVGTPCSYSKSYGESVTVTPGDTTQTFTLTITGNGSFGVQEIPVDPSTLSGSPQTVTVGGTYEYSGMTCYVNSITVNSAPTALSATSTISGLESRTNISSLTTSSAITKMSQNYTTAAEATTSNPMTLTMSDGSTVTQTSGTYTVGYSLPVTTMITVYDTLGNTHSIPVYFTRTEVLSGDSTTVNGNTWTISLDTVCNRDMSPTADSPVTCSFANASDSAFTSSLEFTSGSIDKSNSNLYISAISGGTSSTSGTTTTLTASESSPIKLTVQDAAGNTYTLAATSGSYTYTTASGGVGSDYLIQYVSGGELPTSTATLPSADGTTTTISMKNTDLLFTTAGKYYSGSPTTTTMTLSNGALETQTITLDCNSLTQFAGSSTINGTADGNAAGTLKSVSIDSSGVITGVYTNGVKQSEAQIAIAQFTNASGLTKTGSSLYQASSNSGTPNVKTAADLGVSITPSALEMSNVDIANEFSDMIITQRGFQSNSKIITVSDEMLETMINMKR